MLKGFLTDSIKKLYVCVFDIIDPDSRPLVSLVGEGHRENLLDFVSEAVDFYSARNELNSNSIDTLLYRHSLKPSMLLFPGKIAINPAATQLAISDTGHHRVIVTDLNGKIQESIGSVGFANGSFKDCQFKSPQGICWDSTEDILYVADTDNHAIRKIDLNRKEVTTLAGSGFQGHDLEGGKIGTQQEISSPWDLCLGHSIGSTNENVLFIAMAGIHQVWMYFLENGTWLKGSKYEKGTCVRFAGTGNEENRNNSYPTKAAFAQPSGICKGVTKIKDELVEHLFVADSESSCVRCISLKDGSVKAVVGGERDPMNLFAYGDTDGKGIEAKLQHPLGVTASSHKPGTVIVADSYNHKLKSIESSTKECHTFPIFENTKKMLDEPGGLCLHPNKDRIYLADTNNHKIMIYDTETDTLTELEIRSEMTTAVHVTDSARSNIIKNKTPLIKRITNKTATVVPQGPITVSHGDVLHLDFKITLANGLHLTEEAPSACQLLIQENEDIQKYISDDTTAKQMIKTCDKHYTYNLNITTKSNLKFELETLLYYCDDVGVCMRKSTVYVISVNVFSDNRTQDKKQSVVYHTIEQNINRESH